MNRRFGSILTGAFLLEGAGYFAFPYISVALRDQFHLSERDIGTLFLVALASRPIWAILGGWLAERVTGRVLFLAACIAEAVGFFLLGKSTEFGLGALAVLLGNFGFSIWTPNLFTTIYKTYGKEESVKRISLLNGALNAGAATGCLAGALLTLFEARSVFYAASGLYLLCLPILLPVLGRGGEEVSQDPKVALGGNSWKIGQIVGLLLASLGFWGSYSQFNAFFSLYAKDWLGNTAFTGVAFGVLALSVSLLSVFFARLKDFKKHLRRLSLCAAVALLAAWQWKTTVPTLISATLFVLVLANAEALLTVFLAEGWSKLSDHRQGLMQGLNFASRNVAMGIGTLIGGRVYHEHVGARNLSAWGVENGLFCLVCFLGIVVMPSHLFKEGIREKPSTR